MSAHKTRIPVYPFGTNAAALPGCPPHSASKSLALLALAAFAVKRSDDRSALIQLTREPWGQVRKRLRGAPLAVAVKHEALNPADYHVMAFQAYPPTGQESDARERRAKLWLNAERF